MFYVFDKYDKCRYVTEDENDAMYNAEWYYGYYTEDTSNGFNSWVDEDSLHKIDDVILDEQNEAWYNDCTNTVYNDLEPWDY